MAGQRIELKRVGERRALVTDGETMDILLSIEGATKGLQQLQGLFSGEGT